MDFYIQTLYRTDLVNTSEYEPKDSFRLLTILWLRFQVLESSNPVAKFPYTYVIIYFLHKLN